MFAETLNGVRERRGRRWFLILPVVFAGTLLSWTIVGISSLVAMPWTWDEDGPGLMVCFAAAYTFVGLAAIVAPWFKRAVALLAALALLSFFYPWYGANPDPDANWPADYWIGMIAGICLALVLVFLKFRSRWLLVVPAYWLGFLTLMIPSLLLLALISVWWPQASPPSGFFIVTFFASFGAVAFPALTSPGYPIRIAVYCLLVNVALGIDSLIEWLKHGDITYLTLPSLLFGGLAALGFIFFRAHPECFWRWLRRTDPSTSSG